MPRRKQDPSYRLHKQSGQAIVTLPDGMGGRRDVQLRPHGSPESWDAYYRTLAEWRAGGARVAATTASSPLTFYQLILAYWQQVESYYVKDGKPTSEQATIKYALRYVKQLYGPT